MMKNNVKKTYETPEAEKIMFNYRDQVVAASQGVSKVSGSILVRVPARKAENKHLEHLS